MKIRQLSAWKMFLITIALAGLCTDAEATILAYTGFDYASGQLAGDQSANDVGFAGDPWTGSLVTPIDTTSSLSYPSGVSLGSQLGKISVTTTGVTHDHHRTLATSYSLDAEMDYYFSFLLKVNSNLTLSPQAVQVYMNLTGDVNIFEYSVGTNDQFRGIIYPSTVAQGGLVVAGETYFVVGNLSAKAVDPDIVRIEVYQTSEGGPFLNTVGAEPTTWFKEGMSAITGSFNELSVRAGVNALWEIDELRMGTTWADVTGASAAVPGDFDSDGDVDGADFVAWQTNFPKAVGATLAEGDADADGDVDGADFVVWQTNFPFTPGPGATPIPEPQAIVLAAFGGLLVLAWRSTVG